MDNLFEVQGSDIVIDKKGIKSIKCFRELMDLDRGSKGDYRGDLKLQFKKQLVFLYLYLDFKSPIANLSDEERRKEAILNSEIDKKDLDLVELQACIEWYKEFQVKTNRGYRLIVTAIDGIEKVRKFIETTDVDSSNIKEYNAILLKVSDNYDNLLDLEEKAKKSLDASVKTRGGQEKGMFEDADD